MGAATKEQRAVLSTMKHDEANGAQQHRQVEEREGTGTDLVTSKLLQSEMIAKTGATPILIGVFRSLRVVFRARDLVFRVLRRPNNFPMIFSIFLAK